mgnify:CR=1 FL=1
MSIIVIDGDCRDELEKMSAESIHCCVTSPPYWGLRDYGEGDQIGLEATPEAYVEQMVNVFREVRRVLRDDGTVWLNLGDSYSGSGKGPSQGLNGEQHHLEHKTGGIVPAGLKPKDLVGIPWRVAFALQADGWYLRQDIIWSKPNPMPESVTDRCTKAHEYIFILSKSAKYYYDADAIKEPLVTEPHAPGNKKLDASRNDHDQMNKVWGSDGLRNKRSVWTVTTKPFSGAHFATFPPDLIEPCIKAGCPKGGTVLDPFGGAGTTGMVADRLGRNAVLIELNADYAQIARDRLVDDCPLFTEIKTEMETDE